MSINPAEFDRETFARNQSYINLVSLVAPIIVLTFWPIDRLIAPELANQFLAIRLIIAICCFSVHFVSKTATNPIILQSCGFFMTAVCALGMHAIIYFLGAKGHLYFGGLNLILIGSIIFVEFGIPYIVVNSLVVYLPYPLITVFLGDSPLEIATTDIFNGLSTLVFCILVRVVTLRLRRQDFKNRDLLSKEIGQRKRLTNAAIKAAHDIRSPIGALRAVVDTLDLQKEHAELLDESAVRIEKIANDLLGDFKSDAYPKKKLTLSELSKLITKELNAYINDKDLPLVQFSPPADASSTIEINEGEFVRSILNIVENAHQSYPGSFHKLDRHVEISADIVDEQLIIKIKDEGKGIPEKLKAQIGQLGMTSDKPDGTGIGLWSVFEFCKKHSGHLEFQSNPIGSSGTIVLLTLPLLEKTSS